MKKTTRVWSALLAVLMILTVCPVMALSAQDVQSVAAPEYWNGAASSSTTTVTDVMAFVQAGTAYTAKVTDLEGHLIIDTDKKEIHIVDELGFAIFVIMTNNPYTIYEADGTTVKYDGERETAIDDTYGITDIVANATIYLDNDLYLNDPAKDVSTWKSTAPMFMRPIPNRNAKNGSLTFDGQGHSITGWYLKAVLTSAEHGCSFGLFGMPVVYGSFAIKNVAMLSQKINLSTDGTFGKTNPLFVGGLAAGAWMVNGECHFVIDSVMVDLEADLSMTGEGGLWNNFGNWYASLQDGTKSSSKALVFGGLVANTSNRPSAYDQKANIQKTTIKNAIVNVDVAETAPAQKAWGATILTQDASVDLTMENIVALSTVSGFNESSETYAPSIVKRASTPTSLSYNNIFVNGALHTDMADTTYGQNFSTTATADDLLPYNIYKQQRDKGAFWGWDIEGEIAVPATLASQATAIDAILNTDTTAYWDGTVPGIVDGVEVDNILAEGESILDYIVANKAYTLSKAQFDAHIKLGTSAGEGRYYGVTILDEIGLAMWAIMTSNDWKILNADSTEFYSSSLQGTEGYTVNGVYQLSRHDSNGVYLGRDMYLNDPDKPKSEWNEFAPLYLRFPKEAKQTVANALRFDGKGNTVYGWYVNHTLTAQDVGMNKYGFIGNIATNYAYAADYVKNLALVNSCMDITLDASFESGIVIGAVVANQYFVNYKGWGGNVGAKYTNLAADTEINLTVRNGAAADANKGIWCGNSSSGSVANNSKTKSAIVCGLLGGITAPGGYAWAENSTFEISDALVNLDVNIIEGAQYVAQFGLAQSFAGHNAIIKDTVVMADFTEPSGEGFAVPTFSAGARTTNTFTNFLVNGEKHVLITDESCRTVGSLDLIGDIFAQNKGEGFANWSTDGDVAVPTSFLADAAAFGDAILTDSAIRALGVSIRNVTTLEKQGLRFSVEVNLDALTAAGYTLKYGALFIPAREVNMKGSTLEVDTENVLDFGEYDIRLLEAEDDGASASMWTYENAKQFNCAIVNLPQLVTVGGQVLDTFNVDFAMRGYVQVLDGEGEVVATVYTRTVTASLVDVARYIVEHEAASEEVIENLLVLIERAEQALQAA